MKTRSIVWLIGNEIKIYRPNGDTYRSTKKINYPYKLKNGVNYLTTEEFNKIKF